MMQIPGLSEKGTTALLAATLEDPLMREVVDALNMRAIDESIRARAASEMQRLGLSAEQLELVVRTLGLNDNGKTHFVLALGNPADPINRRILSEMNMRGEGIGDPELRSIAARAERVLAEVKADKTRDKIALGAALGGAALGLGWLFLRRR